MTYGLKNSDKTKRRKLFAPKCTYTISTINTKPSYMHQLKRFFTFRIFLCIKSDLSLELIKTTTIKEEKNLQEQYFSTNFIPPPQI